MNTPTDPILQTETSSMDSKTAPPNAEEDSSRTKTMRRMLWNVEFFFLFLRVVARWGVRLAVFCEESLRKMVRLALQRLWVSIGSLKMTVFPKQASAIIVPPAPKGKSERTTKSIRNGDANKDDIVRLNVGGTRYDASRDTLMRYEGSMLASLVSGKWKEGDGDTEIFIDRSGRRFEYILDYLRSDRVYVPDLSYHAALLDEFEYFGIDVDESKVAVTDDFTAINELGQEIRCHQAIIEQERKKIAAMQESYQLASDFAKDAERSLGLYSRTIGKDVDKELLRSCLLSRGLYVVSYGSDRSGLVNVNICTIGTKDEHVTN